MKQTDIHRRKFLVSAAKLAGTVGTIGLILAGYIKSAHRRVATAIRPPGALPEPDFLSACVHCGLCVEDCPFDILKLATLDDPVSTGTPYFIARNKACEMCTDIPCVKACPTGALSHDLTDITQADMGLAVFTGAETCYAMQGSSCRACYMACPVKDNAIVMKQMRSGGRRLFQPTVFADACTGCGMCEEACVTPDASIQVLPRSLATRDTGTALYDTL